MMSRLSLVVTLNVLLLTSCIPGRRKTQVVLRGIPTPVEMLAADARNISGALKLVKRDGRKYLLTSRGEGQREPTPQDKDRGGSAFFDFSVKTADTYTLFAQVFWHDSGSNSFWIRMNDGKSQRLGNFGAYGKWIWVKGPAWQLSPGPGSLRLREREWGARLAKLYLTAMPDYVTRAAKFQDGCFRAEQTQLLVDPPYSIDKSRRASFRVFLVRAGETGILVPGKANTLKISNPLKQTLYTGNLNAAQEALVNLSKLIPGEYQLSVGEQSCPWAWLGPRFDKLEKILAALKTEKNPWPEHNFWLPTLELYHSNVLRGYKQGRQDKSYLQSLDYVKEQLTLAEKLAEAFALRDFTSLDIPGCREMAFRSAVDDKLCPYIRYLPASYFAGKKKTPLVLYLHGANGTQWEMERCLDFLKRQVNELKHPMIMPYSRGNSGYVEAAGKDLLQLLGTFTGRYRIDKSQLVIAGFSMGGFGTWRTVLTHPNMFKVAVPIAGGIDGNYLKKQKEDKKPVLPQKLNTRFIIIHSPADKTIKIDHAQTAKKLLTARKIPFKFISYDSGHKMYEGIIEVLNELFEANKANRTTE
jgi:pimeloyl-ACP methyl ester carboxylesterase